MFVAQQSVVFFFFSSRRRHTRCGRDWSSDVCSSDLALMGSKTSAEVGIGQTPEGGFKLDIDIHVEIAGLDEAAAQELVEARSEERRVGKECRCRRGQDQ